MVYSFMKYSSKQGGEFANMKRILKKCPSLGIFRNILLKIFRFSAVLLSFSLCLAVLPACAGAAETAPVSYDAAAGIYDVAGRSCANLFEYSLSTNKNYLIYVASQINQEPEAWLYDRAANEHHQLTDNGYFIESQARVDNSGNRALVLTEVSNARSKLLYNGEAVADNGLLNRSLCFWEGKLFYASWDLAAGTTGLFLYDPTTQRTETLADCLPLATGLSAAAGDAILLEAYDTAAGSNVVLSVRPEAEGEARINVLSGGDSFLLPSAEAPQVLQISGDNNAKYLFNAYYWLNRYQSGEPWSGSPDSAGRVSWNESYRLLGMTELWEKTGDAILRTQISAAAKRLISTRKAALQNGEEEQDAFLFVTKKYSLDQQAELRLMVNNAEVYTPMLRAANVGCLEEEDRRALLAMAEAAFQYYEEDWDPATGCYRFRKGEPFHLDGSVMPFNQQNAFGLCLMELWKATGNPVYRERCTALARTFEKELEITEDGRTIWHYWPQSFYVGWTEADGVSQNTPVQPPIDNPPYEDSSHASTNAEFILEYYNTFHNVFSPEQVQGLRRTLDAICTDEGCSTVIEPVDADGWFLNSRWAKIISSGERNTAFARRFLSTDTFSYVEFDSQIPLAFARLYDPKAGGSLRASILLYEDGTLRPLEKHVLSTGRIPALAERLRTVPIG